MTVKFGISMRDEVHEAARRAAATEGVPLSAFIDRAVAREIYRRQVAEHNAMLREAGADSDQHRAKATARRARHQAWKNAQARPGDGDTA